ncbi:MAG: peptidoglycan-binding protein [Promicromonosporaceae bacterium]|nr:peptidoglycan-binding protein [Promicromonosporaceae bacterium]
MNARKSSRPRRLLLVVLTAALGVGLGVVAQRLLTDSEAATSASATEPITTPVEYGTLTSDLRLNGRLSFGEPEPLPVAQGMITALPEVGQGVGHGEPLFAVDGSPVVLFTGEAPFWRDLSTATSCTRERPCADVAQLQRNLIDLSFLDTAEPSGRFDDSTRLAVRAWQRELGVEVTGRFAANSVVLAQAAPVRIASVSARLGDTGVSPATIGATAMHGSVLLTEAQARDLVPGTAVTVALRDGTEVPGVLAAVDGGGEPLPDGQGTTPATATVDIADQEALAGAAGSSVRITVGPQGPGEEETATLIVPATAILATVDGGYAVEVWDGEAFRRVDVEIGLVADARVQILGGALSAGDLVVLSR